MYVLMSAYEGMLELENTVTAYDTEEEAHDAMVNEIRLDLMDDDPEATFREDNDGEFGDYEVNARCGHCGSNYYAIYKIENGR